MMFAIVAGSKRMQTHVLAGGVETFEAVEALSAENIRLMQGYFFGCPTIASLPEIPDDVETRFADRRLVLA
jgi:EAL domain-containing protein (putative c-di-GMP-specific phosphodiesterase class I)